MRPLHRQQTLLLVECGRSAAQSEGPVKAEEDIWHKHDTGTAADATAGVLVQRRQLVGRAGKNIAWHEIRQCRGRGGVRCDRWWRCGSAVAAAPAAVVVVVVTRCDDVIGHRHGRGFADDGDGHGASDRATTSGLAEIVGEEGWAGCAVIRATAAAMAVAGRDSREADAAQFAFDGRCTSLLWDQKKTEKNSNEKIWPKEKIGTEKFDQKEKLGWKNLTKRKNWDEKIWPKEKWR